LPAEDRVDFGPVFDAELDTLFNSHVITARSGLARLITAASGGYVVGPVVAHRRLLRGSGRRRRLLRRSGLPGLDVLGLVLWAVFVSTRWPAAVGAGGDLFARVALSTPRT
jgi:hypothetical protein